MTTTAYAIRAEGTICRAEEDPRLCIYSDLADAVKVHQLIRTMLPDAQIVAVQLVQLEVMAAITAPPILGVLGPLAIPAFAGDKPE